MYECFRLHARCVLYLESKVLTDIGWSADNNMLDFWKQSGYFVVHLEPDVREQTIEIHDVLIGLNMQKRQMKLLPMLQSWQVSS